jgi:crotonobetainyl-CoA:carnitine CoA-transferase CaiB-like acyl-CoA transferase
VIVCRAQGWPSDSAEAERPAYDDVIQAASGIAHSFQLQHGVPALAPTLVADKVSGLMMVTAVLAALVHRERTGAGQFVEVPMIDALTSFTLVEHGCAAIPEPALGPAGYPRIVAPDRRPFATSDGWMAVLPYSKANYEDLFAVGGRDDLIGDPRLVTARSRIANAADLYAAVAPIIATRTTAEWVEFCAVHDIPAGAVRTLDELVDELPVVEHPVHGPYHLVPPPIRFSGSPAGLRRHAPMLGEHGHEVLAEIGWGADRIAALVDSGAMPVPG